MPGTASPAEALPLGGPGPAGIACGPPSRENAWRRPDRRPGQEIQGGPGALPPAVGSSPGGSLWSAGAFRTAGPGGRGPVRGFPPAPGAPDPVYPPGQFLALERARAAHRRRCRAAGLAAGSGPDPAEPEYSLLAVSDPSADATATQTWAVLDDALLDEWSAAPERSGPGESPRPRGRWRHQDSGPGVTRSRLAAALAPVWRPPRPSGYADVAGTGNRAGVARVSRDAGYPGQTDPSLRASPPAGTARGPAGPPGGRHRNPGAGARRGRDPRVEVRGPRT